MKEVESCLTSQIFFNCPCRQNLKSSLKGRMRPNGLKPAQQECRVTKILFLVKTKSEIIILWESKLLFFSAHVFVFSGVGAMTWSPLACGIISGKYDGRVPPYSRASLKVDVPHWLFPRLYPTLIICAGVTVVFFPTLVAGCLFIVCLCLSGSVTLCTSHISVCFSVPCRRHALLYPCTSLPAGVSLTHMCTLDTCAQQCIHTEQ